MMSRASARGRGARIGLALLFMALATALPAFGLATQDLGDLSLEELSSLTVTTVSGRDEPLSGALASIYVITADDIRRSGYTTLPEVLRLAPNLEVARTGANGYAITARGFNGTFANKLLVLVDGRSIYTPTFSGVFWDAQGIMLDDIDRIEVISGPGGVLWGVNAVNGVINILSKPSGQTAGGLATAGGGNTEARAELRYGGAGGRYRIYGQASRLEETTNPDGTENADGTDRLQAGFRTDWSRGANGFTVQGDAYGSENGQEPDPQELRGANLLGRWSRDLDGGDVLRLQAYYDYTSRQQQRLDTADLALEEVLHARGRHSITWGAGFRHARDRIDNTAAFAFIPESKSLNSWNATLNDKVALRSDLELMVGAKVDRNPYTGIELLPSVRLGWRISENHLLWTDVSRAVRTPSRFDRELFLPGTPPFLLAGGPDFESEISYVYELGYRGKISSRFNWSTCAFYNDLEKQRSISPGPAGAVVANDREGHSHGFEAWGVVHAAEWWRLWAGYSYLDKELHVVPGAVDLQPESSIGSDPKQWLKLRSAMDLGRSWALDLMVRHYDDVDNLPVSAYTAADARLAWSRSERVEISLLLQNLTDAGHVEWSPGAEFERAGYLKVLVRF